MGSIGTTATKPSRGVYQIYSEDNVGYKDAINQQFRQGNITREQRDKALEPINAGIQEILEHMTDNFEEANINALRSTMDRKLALTSDSDITGAVEFYKTANGFVLNAPSTRSNFRAFMDDEGHVRRMPANEMNTAQEIRLSGKHTQFLSNKFEELYRRKK